MGSSCEKPHIIQEINLEVKVYLDNQVPNYSPHNSVCSLETNYQIPNRKNPIKSKFFQAKNDSIIQKKSSLELEVTESKLLEKGKKIVLTPTSINNKYHSSNETFKFGINSDLNDYNFPSEEKMGLRQFSIKYDQKLNSYKIKDSSQGTGLFILINGRTLIDCNFIVCFANNHIVLSVDQQTHFLKLIFLKGEYENKTFMFDPEELRVVTCGRSKTANISLKDDSTSRIQFSVRYENYSWYLYDGLPEKPSTNGIWFLAYKYYQMKTGTIFKSGYSTFVSRLN